MPRKKSNILNVSDDRHQLALEIIKFTSLLNAGGILVVTSILAGAASNSEDFFWDLSLSYYMAIFTFATGLFAALSFLYINMWLFPIKIGENNKILDIFTKLTLLFPAIMFVWGVEISFNDHLKGDKKFYKIKLEELKQVQEKIDQKNEKILKQLDLLEKETKDLKQKSGENIE